MDYFSKGDWVRDTATCHSFIVAKRKGTKLADGSICEVFYQDELDRLHPHTDCIPLPTDKDAMIALIQATARAAADKQCLATLAELSDFKALVPSDTLKEAWQSLPTAVKAAITEMSKVKAVAR